MKKIVLSCLLLALAAQALFPAQNQDYGSEVLRCRYRFSFKKDITKKGNLYYQDTTMTLDFSGDRAVFYSEKFYLQDSTLNVAPLPISIAVNPPPEFQGTKEYSRYFIDFRESTYIKFDQAIMTKAKGRGELELPQWTLLDATDTICGHPCRTARAQYMGREWTVWYATDIPVYAGPWILWGAPGLILKARDSDRLFVITATEVGTASYNRWDEIFTLSDNRNNLRSYKSMRKMETVMTRVKRSYDEDMQLNGLQGGPIKAINPDGSVETIELEMKYIPLIPEEYWEKNRK